MMAAPLAITVIVMRDSPGRSVGDLSRRRKKWMAMQKR
jgi:hypothetical protein